MTVRVVVAGAGVFGSCIAVSLARAGMSVTLADPARPGDNASGVAAGMLAPASESLFDHRPEHFERLLEARDLWPAFAASIGVEIDRAGALAVSFDEEQAEGWSRALRNLGIVAALLPPAEISRAHPELTPGLSGVSIDLDWRLDAPRALQALKAEADRLGVALRRSALIDFAPGRARFQDGSTIDADALVIATGSSPSLVRTAPELAGLTPIKGHILQIADANRPSQVVRFDGGYLCPTLGGVLLGATMEAGHADTAIDAERIAHLIALGRRYAPDLDYASVTARVGVRASTAAEWPLIGRAKAEGVWLAVGARRNGWLLAPMVARSIAREIAGS